MPLRNGIISSLIYAICISAQANTYGDKVIGGNAKPPTYADLSRVLLSPNATGSFKIHGPNISEAYPATMVDGWELGIDPGPCCGGGTQGSATPPSVVNSTAGSGNSGTWSPCISVYGIYGIAGFHGDGACSGLLSAACINGIKKTVANAQTSVDGGACPTLPDNMKDFGCPFNGDQQSTPLKFNDTHQVVYLSDYAGSADDKTWYNKVGTITYPVIITWGHSNDGKLHGALSGDHVTVACARADNTAPGSQPAVAGASGIRRGSLGLSAIVVSIVGILLI
ncbi:hypothetical protein JX265_003074 [Neoarthrinium moseri]|uniref:Uncharacterized protein n=1 Tax=Neoarthrinium moseri TaxID=1658444 RepID=A0A9P9WT65_9PEZI|nr:hypothetical protein JX265_003074 [Neoarthrinium moseri]